MQFSAILFFSTAFILVHSQEIKPVVIITNKDGRVNAEQALLQIMSCDEENCGSIIKASNGTISTMNKLNEMCSSQLNFSNSMLSSLIKTVTNLNTQLLKANEKEQELIRELNARMKCISDEPGIII